MVILWSETYFERLWCNAEVATFSAVKGGADNVDFLPLWLAPWLLSTISLDCISVTIYNRLAIWTNEIGAWLSTQDLSIEWVVFFELLLGVGLSTGVSYLPCSLPNLFSFQSKIVNHQMMLRQIAEFRLQDAKCAVESDREIVEEHVGRLFLESPYTKEQWCDVPQNFQMEAIERFNHFVREDFSASISKRVGLPTTMPYSAALTVFMPLNFSALCIILGCDGADCESSASVQGYSSVAQYMCANTFMWVVQIFLIFPTTYPVMLRCMQFCMGRIETKWLQQIACTAAIMSCYFYMSFLEGFAVAVIGLAVSMQTPFWVGLLVLVLFALILWNYLLFFRTADVDATSTYAPLSTGDPLRSAP